MRSSETAWSNSRSSAKLNWEMSTLVLHIVPFLTALSQHLLSLLILQIFLMHCLIQRGKSLISHIRKPENTVSQSVSQSWLDMFSGHPAHQSSDPLPHPHLPHTGVYALEGWAEKQTLTIHGLFGQ